MDDVTKGASLNPTGDDDEFVRGIDVDEVRSGARMRLGVLRRVPVALLVRVEREVHEAVCEPIGEERMNMSDEERISRRRFLQGTGAAVAGFAIGRVPAPSHGMASRASGSLRIGIIGSGRMGGAVGLKWAEAGHRVFFSSRNPDQLTELVSEAGPDAQAGLPGAAAEFGDVVLIAVPYGVLPQVGRDYGPRMQGKIVIDCCNPRADRDGPMADDAIARGTGVASAEYLPGVRLVRAFSAVSFTMVRDAPRPTERIGIPIAGNDPEAIEFATRLVEDAGFDPVFVGGLERAREFDRGTAVYVRGMSAAELREALNRPPEVTT